MVEEEDERGMAHIIEHLAFRATARYTNHDVVKFLESIGAKLGACQNALTTTDETIYEFSVPLYSSSTAPLSFSRSSADTRTWCFVTNISFQASIRHSTLRHASISH